MQHGYYQQPPPPQPTPQPGYQQPPHGYNPNVQTIQSMLNIAGILALIIGIIVILVAVWDTVILLAIAGEYDIYGGGIGWWGYDIYGGIGWGWIILIPLVTKLIFSIINFIIFMQTRAISTLVSHGNYYHAKQKTLIWMIIYFILAVGMSIGFIPTAAGIIVGILLLIAYLNFPPSQYGYQQQAPPPQYQQPPQH